MGRRHHSHRRLSMPPLKVKSVKSQGHIHGAGGDGKVRQNTTTDDQLARGWCPVVSLGLDDGGDDGDGGDDVETSSVPPRSDRTARSSG